MGCKCYIFDESFKPQFSGQCSREKHVQNMLNWLTPIILCGKLTFLEFITLGNKFPFIILLAIKLMKLFILPISGGGFPIQLAMLMDLGIRPDVMMAASGGNVCAYLSLASNFEMDELRRIIPLIKRDMFVKGSQISAILRDGYAPGDGVNELFKELFTSTSVQEVEILTLAFNMTEVCPCIFSNKSREKSYISQLSEMDRVMYQSYLSHLDGNLDQISTIVMASVAIPMFVQPQFFNGHHYQDGGVCYSSSFTPCSFSLKDNLLDSSDLTQIIYFGSYKLDKIKDIIASAPDRFKRIYEQVHYSLLDERGLVAHFFDSFSNNLEFITLGTIDRSTAFRLLEKYEMNDYLLILEPNDIYDINIFNFVYQDIFDAMERAQYSGYLILSKE